MPHLVHITTVPQTAAAFLKGQLSWLRERQYDVTVVSSPGTQLDELARQEGISACSLPMRRDIAPLADLQSVRKLRRILSQLKPDLVHAHTPKAGLLGMLAASSLAHRPVRLYHLHGLRFETVQGPKRQLLRAAERLTCQLTDRVFCVSRSLQRMAHEQRVVSEDRSRVLCHGSVNGLDIDLFPTGAKRTMLRHETRRRLGIPLDALCLGFVGRLVRDKGVGELAEAWSRLRQEYPNLHLLLVGPWETEDPIPIPIRQMLQEDPRVHSVGPDWNPIPYYAAMDLFTLPTHREGLGNVLLEAAAMELPVVSCRVTGVVDAVAEQQSAILVPAGDSQRLADALDRYLQSPEMRRTHGQVGRKWVEARFQPQAIWEAIDAEYRELLAAKIARRSQLAVLGVNVTRPTVSLAPLSGTLRRIS